MYAPIPSVLSRVLSRPVLLGALLLVGAIAPAGLAENLVSSVATNTPSEVAVNEDESLPLTDAQQAAKQLAATLENERLRAATSPAGPAMVPLSEPGLPYKRFIIELYTSDHVEVVVTGGRPTLVSPVNSEAVDDTDAGRPTLLRPEEGAVAIGVFVD
jgi:hypothetical protein